MTDPRLTVRKADQILRDHPLFKDGKVASLWESVEWTQVTSGAEGDAKAAESGGPAIALLPGLANSADPVHAVLREFGLTIQRVGGQRAQTIWDDKLDLPTPDDIAKATDLLSSRPLPSSATYKALFERYPDRGNAVGRLVFINIVNALIANNVPYSDAQGVNIAEWGPTAEYVGFQRYHSLIPLTSAYCPADVHRCFGCAFAAYIRDGLQCCAESSTRHALERLILNVISRLHPLPPLPRAGA